jgi:hypothetical protein
VWVAWKLPHNPHQAHGRPPPVLRRHKTAQRWVEGIRGLDAARTDVHRKYAAGVALLRLSLTTLVTSARDTRELTASARGALDSVPWPSKRTPRSAGERLPQAAP